MSSPKPLPLKGGDLTLRRTRHEAEAKSFLQLFHQNTSAALCVVGIEHASEEVRERIFLMCTQHMEHLTNELRQNQHVARTFEQTLAKINADFARLGPELELRPEKCHALLAVCAKNQMFLSGFGNLLAIFLHKTADRRFSIYELHAQLQESPESWEKPCATVLDGDLHEGDIFYVATHIPSAFLSGANLQDILVTLPVRGALERLEGFVPPAMPYAGALIQVGTAHEHVPHLRTNPLGSLEILQKTQEHTADILGERPSVKSEHAFAQDPAWMGRTDARAMAFRTLRTLGMGLRAFFALLIQGGSWLLKRAKPALRTVATRLNDRTPSRHEKRIRAVVARATASPLGITLILGMGAMLLVGGFIWWRIEHKDSARHALFTETLSRAQLSLTEAESRLIYQNTSGATESLTHAETILASVTPKTDDETSAYATLQNRITELLEKSQGITRVSPTLLASLPDATRAQAGILTPSPLLFTSGLEVFRFNNLTGAFEKQTITAGVVGTPTYAAEESATSALVLDATQRLARYNATAQTLNPLTSGIDGMKSAEDLAWYNGALYVLTASDQQIVKMRQQTENYEAGTPWISARTSDLTDARALTIDGSVYVLTTDAVRVFFAGKEQLWTLGTLTDSLKNPTDIFTIAESSTIAILDPENTRIVIADKTSGAIIAQYVSDTFADAFALRVDESANVITVLTPTSLLQFTPNHLVQ